MKRWEEIAARRVVETHAQMTWDDVYRTTEEDMVWAVSRITHERGVLTKCVAELDRLRSKNSGIRNMFLVTRRRVSERLGFTKLASWNRIESECRTVVEERDMLRAQLAQHKEWLQDAQDPAQVADLVGGLRTQVASLERVSTGLASELRRRKVASRKATECFKRLMQSIRSRDHAIDRMYSDLIRAKAEIRKLRR
jgi:hypothetical protein